ncbi:e3 ubiquitin-protein ligase COP1 [Trichonephila clavipes]|nr:e3 ubiquitin-protein ligase COP1 [Trichonephila clavipes]
MYGYNNSPHDVTGFPPAYLMFGTLPYDSPLPNQVKLNYPPIQQARQIAVNRTIKHHKINKQSDLNLFPDHCVHYYDLRNSSRSVEVFSGHKKAVSYVKFLNGKEIVSASTDSQLKLWNVGHSCSLRSFKGHLNEKNFVGLATDGDFITCGSENNALYVYFKGLSSHVLTFKFETIRSILEKEKKEEDGNEFVSAVCWRTGTNAVVAANSQGNIKILELM